MEGTNKSESLPTQVGGFQKTVANLDYYITKITKFLHMISCVILFGLMFLTIFDVIGRFFFNAPIKGTMELTKLSVALMVFLSLGYAQVKGDHLEIDFIVQKFKSNLQHGLKFCIYLVMTIVLFILTWQLFVLGINAQAANELSGDLKIPLYYFIYPVAVSSIGFALSYLVAALKSLNKVVMK